jgi:predicted glycosyltransferase
MPDLALPCILIQNGRCLEALAMATRAAQMGLGDVYRPDGTIEPNKLTEDLKVSKAELANATGLSRDAVSKTARLTAPSTQRRLREMVEINTRVLPWAGSIPQTFAWYRAQPLPSFGDQTR